MLFHCSSVGGICTYELAQFWRLVVLVVFCVMSSIKQIGYPVPTLCRKMTISPVPTGIVPVRSFGDRLLIYFWLATLLICFFVCFELVLLLIDRQSFNLLNRFV